MTCSYNNNSKCDIYYRYITRNLSKRLGDVVYVLYRCVLGEWWTRSQNASVECLPVQSSAGYLIDSHQTNLGRWQSAKAGGKRPNTTTTVTATVVRIIILLHTGSSEDAAKPICLRRKHCKSLIMGTYYYIRVYAISVKW
jgi:hypothetical protein